MAAHKEWQSCRDYGAALRLNRLFLRRKRECTVFFGGNLYKETEPLIPKLLRLQEYGFLTHSSQPFQTAESSQQAGWWVDSLQRPYISFAIPTNDRIPSRAVRRLCHELLAHPQIATLITQ